MTYYNKRLRKISRSYLSGQNIVQAINSYAVLVLRYSGGLIHWTKQDLFSLDVLTRKQLTLHRAFHKKGDVDRLYIPCNLGSRCLLSIEDSIVGEKRSLSACHRLLSLGEDILSLVNRSIWYLI